MKKRVRIILEQDEDCANPRTDFDHVGRMVCWHRRYSLGDPHEYSTPQDFEEDMAAAQLENGLDDLEEMLDKLWEEIDKDVADLGRDQIRVSREEQLKCYHDKRRKLINNLIELSGNVILPLYLYDHSGLTMNTTGFTCQWDSGQVGWIYVPAEVAMKEWGTQSMEEEVEYRGEMVPLREVARRVLIAEVEEYDMYLTGDVWWYQIVELDEDDEELDILDSCGGFFGHQYAEQEARDAAKNYEIVEVITK